MERADAKTLICRIPSGRPGLKSFRAEFSLDGGDTWIPDTVADAWILIDPSQVDGLRVYILIPNVSGTVADWKADLTRIRDMGFNSVHLLPITTMDTSESPFAARDLFDIDPRYLVGTSPGDAQAQFDGFVAEAKSLKMGLGLCLVLNHVGVSSTMAQQTPDWIVPDQSEPDGLKRAGAWTDQGWRKWNDLVLINYEHPTESVRWQIWAYMTSYAMYWARYANETGGFVRFDNLHSSDPEFIQSVTSALHEAYPRLALLAEYFTDEQTMLRTGPLWGLNLILATPWNQKFVPELRKYLNYLHRISEHVRYFMPVTSHDCGAPAQEFGTADSTVPRYVAAALLGTGATGMPQGVELGENERIDFIGRKPKMRFPEKPRFARFIACINAILAEYSAFRRGGNCQFIDGGHPAILAAFRRDTGPQVIGFLVVCNFDIHTRQRIVIDVSRFLGEEQRYSCRELLSGDLAPPPGPTLDLTLPPCSARVLMFHKP